MIPLRVCKKKGLVRTISGRPKRFEVFNLEEGLKNFLKFKESEFKDELDKMTKVSEIFLRF